MTLLFLVGLGRNRKPTPPRLHVDAGPVGCVQQCGQASDMAAQRDQVGAACAFKN